MQTAIGDALRLMWFYTKTILIFIGLVTVMAALLPAAASAHSWYDRDCCSGRDCAPVLEEWRGTQDGKPGRFMTSKHGTVFVPHDFIRRRPSRDWGTHVCIGFSYEDGKPYPRCVYEGSGV